MDPAQLSDDQLDDLATKLAPRLPTGTHGDRVITTRRQFIGAATGTLGAGALIALGVDPASAQAAGQQGTASEPNDMFAYDLNVANGVTSSLPMNGNDIEDAGSVSTDKLSIGNVVGAMGWEDGGSYQTIPSDSTTTVDWDTSLIEDSGILSTNPSNNEIVVSEDGTYLISGYITFRDGMSADDGVSVLTQVDGSAKQSNYSNKISGSTSIDGRQSFDIPETVLSQTGSSAIDIAVQQTSGSDQDLFNGASSAASTAVFLVRRLG